MPMLKELGAGRGNVITIDLGKRDLDMDEFNRLAIIVARPVAQLPMKYMAWPSLLVMCSDNKLHETWFNFLLIEQIVNEPPKSAGDVQKGIFSGGRLWKIFGISDSLLAAQILNPADSNGSKMNYLKPLLDRYFEFGP